MTRVQNFTNRVAPTGPFYWMMTKWKVYGSEWAKGTRSEQKLDSCSDCRKQVIETIKTITPNSNLLFLSFHVEKVFRNINLGHILGYSL